MASTKHVQMAYRLRRVPGDWGRKISSKKVLSRGIHSQTSAALRDYSLTYAMYTTFDKKEIGMAPNNALNQYDGEFLTLTCFIKEGGLASQT